MKRILAAISVVLLVVVPFWLARPEVSRVRGVREPAAMAPSDRKRATPGHDRPVGHVDSIARPAGLPTREVVASEEREESVRSVEVTIRAFSKQTGDPVSGVKIAMDRTAEPALDVAVSAERHTSPTDKNGYACFDLAPGTYALGRRREVDLQAIEVVEVPREETFAHDLYLPLERSDVLLGQVVDADTGEPIVGASVEVHASLNEWWAFQCRRAELSPLAKKYAPSLRAVTDFAGVFEVATWGVPSKVAVIDHPDHPPWHQRLSWTRADDDAAYRIEVPRSGTLVVSVMDGATHAGGAWVQLRWPQTGSARGASGPLDLHWARETGTQGEARFDRLPSGAHLEMTIQNALAGGSPHTRTVSADPAHDTSLIVDRTVTEDLPTDGEPADDGSDGPRSRFVDGNR